MRKRGGASAGSAYSSAAGAHQGECENGGVHMARMVSVRHTVGHGRKASCPNPFKLGGQGEERTEVCAHHQTGPAPSVWPQLLQTPPLLIFTEHLSVVTCRVGIINTVVCTSVRNPFPTLEKLKSVRVKLALRQLARQSCSLMAPSGRLVLWGLRAHRNGDEMPNTDTASGL